MKRILSAETRKKMSDAKKGRKLSPEHIKNLKGRTPWNKGKTGLVIGHWRGKSRPKGESSANWRGGKCINHNGYILIYKPDHPNPTDVIYAFEHRLIMEKHIGRFLTDDEVVHHINGIRTDNRIENLQLLNKKDHDRISALARERTYGARFSTKQLSVRV